jgi:hypothetical protein
VRPFLKKKKKKKCISTNHSLVARGQGVITTGEIGSDLDWVIRLASQ